MNRTNDDLSSLRTESASGATTVPTPPLRWQTRILLPVSIVGIVLVLILIASAGSFLPAAEVRVVPVVTKTVEGTSGSVTVQAPGWLEPDPYPYYVAALADGVVEAVLVLEGDRVEQGQVVAQLVDDDARLSRQRAEAVLQQRRANRLAAEAELTAAKLRREHLIERTRDASYAAAVVSEIESELRRAEADIRIERAQLNEIQDEYERKSKLTESEAVSEATVARLRIRLDGQDAAVQAAIARQAVLEAKLQQAKADHRAAALNRDLLIDENRAVALAEAAHEAAQGAVALAEAMRDEAALNFERMQVKSPVNGIVMKRLASPGSKLTREGSEHSAHVAHVYDPQQMQVRVDVPLAEAAHVSVGQRAEIMIEVLPDRVFTGTVTRLVHEADIQKNTVEVKVAIDDPAAVLKPEMLARVRFLAHEISSSNSGRQRVFAPTALIQQQDEGKAIALLVTELIEQRGRAEERVVVLGTRRIDDWVEIESGLQPGDLLIAGPTDGMHSGDRVQIVAEDHHGIGG